MSAMEAYVSLPPDGLWSYVFKLLRLRWVIFASGFKRAGPWRKAFTILLGLLVLGIFVGCFLLTRLFLGVLNSPLLAEMGLNTGPVLDAIPATIVSVAFLGILLMSFGVLLQALYLANDMDFLLSAPIPIRAVFLSKLVQAILPSFILVVAVGSPILFSLGASGGYHVLYFPLVLVVLAFLALAAAGISSLLVMAVVRLLPAKRVAEVLALIGAIIVMVLSQFTTLTGIQLSELAPEQIAKAAQVFSGLNVAWSPMAWGGRGLVDLAEGRWLSGILFLSLTLVLSGIVFWFALNTSERLYYSGWASIQVEVQRKKPRRAVDRRGTRSARGSIFRRLLTSEVWALMLKDFKELWRDLRNMSEIIPAMIVGIVFAIMLLRTGGEPPAGKGEAPTQFMELFRYFLAYGSMVIGLFVGWTLISRLALISFSMEGQSYWVIKTAPVSAGKLLVAKFLVAYLPSLVPGWLFLLTTALLQKAPASIIFYGVAVVALILAGLGGINLAFGVRSVNLKWTDPRHMEDGVAGILGIIVSIAYQLMTLLLFLVPPIGAPLLKISEGTGQLIGLLAGGTIALLCTIIPVVLVKDRVCRIGEE